MSAGLGSARIVSRSLSAFPAVLVMIAVVSLGLSFLATTLPRAVENVISNIVRYDVADSSPLNRDVIAPGVGAYDLGASAAGTPDGMTADSAAVWGRLDDQLGDFHDGLPRPLRDALAEADFTASTIPSPSVGAGVLPADIGLRFDPRYLSRITVTEGRAPHDRPAVLPGGETLEVLASESTALQLDWAVGEVRPHLLDNGAGEQQQQLLLVGLFTANDADAAYWTQATATRNPVVSSRTVPPSVVAQLFVDPVGYPAAVEAQLTVKSSVWFSPRAGAMTTENARGIVIQTRQLATSDHQLAGSEKPHLVFSSGLPNVIEESLARSSATQAILATILVSPIGLAVALEILVARLSAERLRPSLALLAARGASRGQRVALVALPVLPVGLLAAAGGLVAGLVIPGGGLGTAGAAATGLVAVAPALLIAVFSLRSVGDGGPSRLARVLRFAAELLIVLATAAAVVASVQREQTVTVDLLSTAVPLLLSLVGCILALRVYPVLMRGVLAGAGPGRGVGAFVGLARAVRGGTAGLVPLVAVIIGVSVAVFSGLLSSTLTTGLLTAAQASVGADISIDNVRLGTAVLDEIRAVKGVQAVAGANISTTQKLNIEGRDRFSVAVGLVDPNDLAAVQRDVPGRVPLDSALSGTSSTAVPVMASAEVADALGGARAGELIDSPVSVVGSPVEGEHLGLSGNFLIIDRDSADALRFSAAETSTLVLVRVEAGASIPAVVNALHGLVPEAALLTTAAQERALLGTNPAIGEVHTAALLAIVGAAVVTSVALVLTVALDGPGRRGTVTLLTAVGLSRRQGASVVRWELAPFTIAGLVGGTLLGIALSVVVMLIVDLRPFTGGYEQPALTVDPILGGGTVALFAAVFTITGGLATRATMRRPPSAPPEKDRHNEPDNHS
jgi:putative ABC transport system permease protein